MSEPEQTMPVEKTDEEWREQLTPMQYEVLRKQGTERAFSGPYWDAHEDGVYRCAGCRTELFSSDAKFDSGTGWPSFTEPAAMSNVLLRDDHAHGMHRVEAVCANCGGHLGHVFDDGPGETGQRWCINGCALDLEPKGDEAG